MSICIDKVRQEVSLPDLNVNMKFYGGHYREVFGNWTTKKESHLSFEILIVLSGKQRTELDTGKIDLSSEDIILIPPGCAHVNSCITPEGMSYFCVHFDIDDPSIQHLFIAHCPILLNKKNISCVKIKEVLLSYLEILSEDGYKLSDRLLIQKMLLDLCVYLLEYIRKEDPLENESDQTSILVAKIIAETLQMNFRKYTDNSCENKHELLSIEMISKKLKMSQSSMLKTFKNVYKISPKQYLSQLQYNEARALLLQPLLSVREVSEKIGYKNVSHFTRQFKGWSGLSPSEYRKKCNDGIEKKAHTYV